jgi:hypothetical protein
MTRFLLALALLATPIANAQQEGPLPTQVLVNVDSKAPVNPTPKGLTLKINNRESPILGFTQVQPNGVQVALLMDDGLRTAVARELDSLRSFIQSFPAGTEFFLGYMQNGRVVPALGADGFTSDLAAAASGLRIPFGNAGASSSPYFCVSDFVKNWPGQAERQQQNGPTQQGRVRKARIVLMITNGVDPYNGSTSVLNQNSPYVATAASDAQRAGVPIYSIYFADAGMRGGRANFSGQSYLNQIADATGGTTFYQGSGSPVSLAPFLKQFQAAVASTYIASFQAPASKDLVSLKMNTKLPKTKLRVADQIRPGILLSSPPQ